MSQSPQKKAPAGRPFIFGAGPKARKHPTGPTPSNEELIAQFHKQGGKVTKCPPRYADGAVESSGDYSW